MSIRNSELIIRLVQFGLIIQENTILLNLSITKVRDYLIIVNVTQLPEIAKLFNINLSGISRQLPTVILFENGIETQRFPAINDEGKIGKVIKYDSAKLAEWFDLPTRYRETAKFN